MTKLDFIKEKFTYLGDYIAMFFARLVLYILARRRPERPDSSGKRYLVVYSGFYSNTHLSGYEIIAAFLRHNDNAIIDGLVCNMAINACDFRSSDNDDINETKNWRVRCRRCVRDLKARLGAFCDNMVIQSDVLRSGDYEKADNYMKSLGDSVSKADYMNTVYDGINIGRKAYESFQRYFFLGSIERILLQPGMAAYEFLRSTVLHVMTARRVLKDYDMIILNESSYSLWGTWALVAYDMGKKTLRMGYNYLKESQRPEFYRNITAAISSDATGTFRIPLFPGTDRINRVFSNQELLEKYSRKGLEILETRFSSNSAEEEKIYSMLDIPKGSFVVCVFTHLCWDATLSFGNMIYMTFEDWLAATYREAIQNKDVYWLFKIHPHEGSLHRIHRKYNTGEYLKSLMRNNGASNIKLIDNDSIRLSSSELLPIINAAVTGGGTVSYEFPSFGIKCVSANTGIHSQLGFTYDPMNHEQYAELLRDIKDLRPPTDLQVKKARAYTALLHEDYISIGVRELFSRYDCGDAYLMPGKLKRFVNEKNEAFKKMLSRQRQ